MCKISAFVLTTNSIENQFPFIESIKSFLPILDELIVVDGGSTDGTIEAIKELNDDRIRIIQDDDTKWEDNWNYGRMGYNFDRGLQECTGDWVIKFDADYILHENGQPKIKAEFKKAFEDDIISIPFTRLNFILKDKYYIKSKKTLAINKTLCKKRNVNLKYGLDLDKWGFGFDFISGKIFENKIWFGDMIRHKNNSRITSCSIYNYDYMFMTEDISKKARFRHFRAENNQRNLEYTKIKMNKGYDIVTEEMAWKHYLGLCKNGLKNSLYNIGLEEHPKIIQDKIKNLSKKQQGYNCWGLVENINTKDYWNTFFKQDRFQNRHCWRITPYQKISECFDFTKIKNKTILDIGCGFGDGIDYIRKINPKNKYNGFDFSEESIKWANQKYKDINFWTQDINDFNSKYDIIIIAETLEHLENDKDIIEKLKKLSDTLIITVPNNELGKNGKLIDEHLHSYTKDDFKNAIVKEYDDYLVIIYSSL